MPSLPRPQLECHSRDGGVDPSESKETHHAGLCVLQLITLCSQMGLMAIQKLEKDMKAWKDAERIKPHSPAEELARGSGGQLSPALEGSPTRLAWQFSNNRQFQCSRVT